MTVRRDGERRPGEKKSERAEERQRSESVSAIDASFVRQILDINPHLIFAKDREGRFTLVNKALAEIYGTSVEELTGKRDSDFNADPAEVENFRRDDLAVMDALEEKFIAEELITDASGRKRWLQTIKRPIVGPNGKADQVLGVATDITRHKELERELAHAAMHDGLTGLPNRVLFRDRLTLELESARRFPERHFAVLLVDLDRFKLVNDSLGHDAGDRLLCLVADRLGGAVRPGDTVARQGGDEFTLLLAAPIEVREAREVAQAVLARLSAPISLGEGRTELYVSASVGLALGDTETESPEQILRDADTAMYRAKASGRNRSAEFDPGMHAQAVAQFELERELRHATEHGEFALYFQPIVRLADFTVSELEALLRWRHPTRGVLAPADFLEAAEESGRMPEIEAWVLPTACAAAARWRAEGRDAGVSVNLSGHFFAFEDPVRQVRSALAASGLPANALRLEITESAVLKRFDRVAAILAELRADGVRADLDDFGTGYSSLAYLHRLPIDRLKIDRSFVGSGFFGEAAAATGAAGEGADIARTIVRLAETLGLETVAEGVESAAQLENARVIGCTHAQGFLFAPARPLD